MVPAVAAGRASPWAALLAGLVAIVRKGLKLNLSLHTMLQVLSVTPFENPLYFRGFLTLRTISNCLMNLTNLNCYETFRTLAANMCTQGARNRYTERSKL
jgi:hypothetical protein